MKYLMLSISVLVTMVIIHLSCNKTSIKGNDNNLNNFKAQEISSLISSLNNKYLISDSAVGNLTINKTKEEGLAIAIQTGDSVKQIIGFSYQDSMHYDFRSNSIRDLGESKVYFFKDLGTSIIVSSKEKKVYVLAVDDSLYTAERVPEIINKFKQIDINCVAYTGYELGRYSGKWKTTIGTDTIHNKNFAKLLLSNSLLVVSSPESRAASPAGDADCPPGMRAITCQAGGAGATSCSSGSGTGCSVSCSSGYVACCTNGMVPACRCSNKPTGHPNEYCVPVD